MLRVEGISKKFGGLLAVNQLTFDIAEGEAVGLIGPNGAGKTTLFNLITGFLTPDEGKIAFRGRSLLGLRPHAVCRQGISRTFQLVKPFLALSILENVMIGAFNDTRDPAQAEKVAREVISLFDFRDRMHSPASSLSLPQRKLLEIARTLATRPRLLLLDESMAGLTPAEVDQMIGFLRRLKQESGVTLLIIEHVMRAIMSVSDRIIVIHHGEKIAEGVPQSIVRNPDVITAYLGQGYLAS
ncbi:MAG: ABC transporter ATP-binding protein [Hyphomicrobiales bacterium]|nr:ABC transporter ATP-binding protein [Hyphomicrobiales bacterium]